MDTFGFEDYLNAEIVTVDMLNSDSNNMRVLIGFTIAQLLGIGHFRFRANSLAIATSATQLSCSLGGSGQSVFVTGLVCYNCPAQTYAIPPNPTGDARVDLISIQYNELQASPHNVQVVEGSPATANSTTGYLNADSVTYNYKQGNSGATPAAPSGFVPFAIISVPPGATEGSQCTVTYLFQTADQIFASFVGEFVSSLNGGTGAQTIVAGDVNVTIGRNAQGEITIDVSGTEGPPGPAGPAGVGIQGPEGPPGPVGPTAQNSPGASFAANTPFSSIAGGNTITVTLPELPGDSTYSYEIEAYATGFDFQSSGGSATLAGANANWGGQAKTGYSYSERSLFIAGTAIGGEAPSASLAAVAPIGMRANTTGFVVIRAVRTS